jgi:hypothetical protein
VPIAHILPCPPCREFLYLLTIQPKKRVDRRKPKPPCDCANSRKSSRICGPKPAATIIAPKCSLRLQPSPKLHQFQVRSSEFKFRRQLQSSDNESKQRASRRLAAAVRRALPLPIAGGHSPPRSPARHRQGDGQARADHDAPPVLPRPRARPGGWPGLQVAAAAAASGPGPGPRPWKISAAPGASESGPQATQGPSHGQVAGDSRPMLGVAGVLAVPHRPMLPVGRTLAPSGRSPAGDWHSAGQLRLQPPGLQAAI